MSFWMKWRRGDDGTRSLRALWVLEEAGVPYERVRLDLSAGEQKSPAFRAINPMAKVTALTDGDIGLATHNILNHSYRSSRGQTVALAS
jgi:glutathione S-transferase